MSIPNHIDHNMLECTENRPHEDSPLQKRFQDSKNGTICPNKASSQRSGGNPGEADVVDQTFLNLVGNLRKDLHIKVL